MKTIEIDDEVYTAIEQRVRGFSETPNLVLRRVLEIGQEAVRVQPPKAQQATNTLEEFLQSGGYVSIPTADEKYLELVGWLLNHHAKLHERLHNYRMRTRIYFSKDRKAIEDSGEGITVKSVPGTAFYAMMTLDNPSKRRIIARVLRMADYGPDTVQRGLATLPDSGIERGQRARLFKQLLA